MRLLFLFLAGILSGAGSLRAQDEKLPLLRVGTQVFSNVTVTEVTATDLYFTHHNGLGTAKLKELEPAMQAHFHFNPEKAAAKQVEQVQANALYSRVLRETPPARQSDATVSSGPADASAVVPPHPIYAKSFLNQPAPVLLAEKWLSAPPNLEGKFVLLDFWATWCGPCRRSIPHLNDLYHKFQDRLVVIGLSDETEAAVRRMTEPQIDYAVAVDTKRRASKAVEVRGIPHTLLIDPRGIVRFEGMPQYLDDKSLERLMAQYGQ